MPVNIGLNILYIFGLLCVQKIRCKRVQIGCKGAIIDTGSPACAGRDKTTQPVRQELMLVGQDFEEFCRGFIQSINDQQTGALSPVNLAVAGKIYENMLKDVFRRGLVPGVVLM